LKEKPMRRSLLLAAVLTLGLAACETSQGDVEGLTGVEWIAESINGKPVIGKVTLTVSDERVGGRSGCNRYFGTAEHKNGTIKISSVGATKMACMRDGLMQQESEFLTTLQASQTYAFRSDDRLILGGPSGTSLVFVGGPPSTDQ
jgi:heat shock protein HslJ